MVLDRFLTLFRCPACQGPLELQEAVKAGPQVQSGKLACSPCGMTYPIVDGIPVLNQA